MRYLVEELGVSTAELYGKLGDTVLLYSARNGKLESAQHLLEHCGATMAETSHFGMTVWDLLTAHMRHIRGLVPEMERHDPEATTALLRVMVLRGVPPPALVAFLLPADKLLVEKGARLRAQLPTYRARRRALVDAHCALIPPLLALVHGYESDVPGTTDDIWAMELGDLTSVAI
jgi:hypothetical protein